MRGELLPPELRFIRCSLCNAPMGEEHRLDVPAGVIWCCWDAAGALVGVGIAGDERFVRAD